MLSALCMYGFFLKKAHDLVRHTRPKTKTKQQQLKNNISQHIIQCCTAYGIYNTEAQRRESREASQRDETLA